MESMATLPWNQWQLSRGMGGNLAVEWVATFAWNTHEGIGPGLTQVLHQPFQHRQQLRRTEALGLEDRRDQASRETLVDM
jgi:hypothetical protein